MSKMIGKRVFNSLYVHVTAVSVIEPVNKDLISKAISNLPDEAKKVINVFKIAPGCFICSWTQL